MDAGLASPTSPARALVTALLWPGLLAGAVAATAHGMAIGHPVTMFNITFLGLGVTLFALERALPHERAWLRSDGQLLPDIAHSVFTKGWVQAIVVLLGIGFVDGMAVERPFDLWPTNWPEWAQVILGLVIVEFGLYWAHRAAHEIGWLWPFHAVHHSVQRLWVINTGRFHVVDALISVLLGQTALYLVGAPIQILQWVAAITAFIGLLTHCNVEMRFGPLNLVFNTPELHRWHHSRVPAEGNTNYGENLMLWDHLFGTFFNPGRRPPVNIGIDAAMPAGFLAQLVVPFRWRRFQETARPAQAPPGVADGVQSV